MLPLLAYAVIVLVSPGLRRTAPRLAVGRVDGRPLAAAVALGAVTSLALVSFRTLARPDLAELAARLPVFAFGNLLLAGVCFSVANAALEELTRVPPKSPAPAAATGATGAAATFFTTLERSDLARLERSLQLKIRRERIGTELAREEHPGPVDVSRLAPVPVKPGSRTMRLPGEVLQRHV